MPDRRGWYQQVWPTLDSCMIDVINHMYMCVACLVVYVCIIAVICVHICSPQNSKPMTQAPKTSTAKPNRTCWKDSEGVCKQSYQQREWHDQSTVNMGTKWTSSHQHQPHASSSTTIIFNNLTYCMYIRSTCLIFFLFCRLKINHITMKNMRLILSKVHHEQLSVECYLGIPLDWVITVCLKKCISFVWRVVYFQTAYTNLGN